MKCQRSVANSGVYEKEDLYGKSAKKGEKNCDGLLTKVLHGLGEKSLKCVQTVALSVHPLKISQFRFSKIVHIANFAQQFKRVVK